MGSILPPARPGLTRDRAEAFLAAIDPLAAKQSVVILGIRGYFSRSFGAPGNDRAVYDDACFLWTRALSTEWRSYNFNTDPSAYQAGIATLCTGTWKYQVGIHGLNKPPSRRYTALVQAGEVTVSRDGEATKETGWFGINIHRGGLLGTSSLGCQTIPPEQWADFISTVQIGLLQARQKIIPYVLATAETLSATIGDY